MLSLRLAIRCIFSRKSSSIVNLIAVASAVALSITVAASLFTVSLQSGLEQFVVWMYGSIDPQLRVVKSDGTMFDRHILDGKQVGMVAPRKDLDVLLECSDRQVHAILSGVDTMFCHITEIDQTLVSGRNPIYERSYGILLGRGIAYQLGIASGIIKEIKVMSIKRHDGFFSRIPMVSSISMLPVGVYALDQDTDAGYAFAHIDRVDELSMDSVMVTSLEILPSDGIGKEQLQSMLPEGYQALNSSDIRQSVFSMVAKEKWVIFFMLLLIAILAALSLAGAVSVMRREKDSDVSTLMVLGYTAGEVRKTFFLLGVSLTIISVLAGILIGYVLVIIQEMSGILTLGGSTFLIDAYPVTIDPAMWFFVIFSSILAGSLISLLSAYRDKIKMA